MPTSLPQSVREHMGEQVAADFSRWFAENVQQELVTNDEYRKVLSRLDVLEERFDHVEERFDRVDERLDRMDERLNQMDERLDAMNAQMNERLDAMNAQMNERFDAMNERMDERSEQVTDQLDRMNDRILSMTRWLIGLLVFFGSMVTALLAVAQFGG
jgi:phage shock protein A